jgi:cell division protein FtsB
MLRKNNNKKALNFSIVGLNLIIYLLIIYFIYHALNGERGIFAYQRLSKDLATKKEVLKALNQEKSKLEHKIKLFNKDNVDLDLLDELSRSKLGLTGKNETVIILKHD